MTSTSATTPTKPWRRAPGALAATLACALLLAPAIASAQAPAQAPVKRPAQPDAADKEVEEVEPGGEKPTSDAESKMLALNEAGFAAFAEGDFVEAATKFEEGYAWVPDPILQKNAAIAWFKADRCQKASQAAMSFLLADEMSAKDRTEARSVLGHCRLAQAERALDEDHVGRAEAILTEVAHLQTDERVDERLAALRMRLVDARVGTSAASKRERTGWILAGVGAAVLVGNVGYHLATSHQRDQLDDMRASGEFPARQRQLQDQVDTADWLVPTLYGVGALTTGSGLWLALSAEPAAGASVKRQEPAALRAPAPAIQVGWSTKF